MQIATTIVARQRRCFVPMEQRKLSVVVYRVLRDEMSAKAGIKQERDGRGMEWWHRGRRGTIKIWKLPQRGEFMRFTCKLVAPERRKPRVPGELVRRNSADTSRNLSRAAGSFGENCVFSIFSILQTRSGNDILRELLNEDKKFLDEMSGKKIPGLSAPYYPGR